MDGEPASSSRSDHALRILVVEDDAFIALDLECQLVELGHEVVGIAATATAAVEMARAARPDIAIVDLRLADGSRGEDAAMTLRVDLDVPSIISSASLHQVTEAERAVIRPTAMLSKPLLPEDLSRAIERHVAAGGCTAAP